MTYLKVLPPAPLRPFIQSFSYWEGAEPSTERMAVMASSALALQIDLVDDALGWYEPGSEGVRHVLKGVTAAGAQTRPFAVDVWQPRLVRVVFRPGGAFPFLAAPPAELRDAHVSLDDLWGPAAGRLQQRLAEAAATAEVFRRLADAFLALLDARPARRHPAVVQALAQAAHAPGGLTVRGLARDADVSPKRFIRLFTHQVGLTPKLYLRIARFERLTAWGFERPRIDWADAAARFGWFDQAHLIRDFKVFAGMTPADWLRRRGNADHHATA